MTGSAPPPLIGLDPQRARRRATAAGWEVAELAVTTPPSAAPSGPQRVIGQAVVGPRTLSLVVAASVAPACPCRRAREQTPA